MIDNYFFDTYSFGFRVQKSCYEAKLSKRAYDKLMSGIGKYADEEDSIRIYKIIGSGQVTVYGKQQEIDDEEIIII